MPDLSKVLVSVASLLAFAGCVTPVRVTPAMSEQVRQMAEWRDTCTQYAAWIAHDYSTNAVGMKKTQELYIAASASANSFIEQVQFDLISGSAINATNYAQAEETLRASTSNFLAYAHEVTDTKPKVRSRGFPVVLAISTITGLVDWGMKLHANLKAADMQQRQMIVKALEDKKWKPFHELAK